MQVKIDNISKSYQDADRKLTVINSISQDFTSGEQIAILGRSGIGKSTLLHLLGGLDRPSSGEIIINSKEITKMNNDQLSDFRAQSVGFVFQFHHLLPDFTALENVAMPLYIQGVSEDTANEQAQEILEQMKLGSRCRHRPGELSGGEQQRVALARALVHKPGLVLADEPTGSLDEETGRLVQELLQGVCRSVGATLVVVTHNRELASSFDRRFEMKSGGQLKQC